MDLSEHFSQFRQLIIGEERERQSAEDGFLYADWTASGRLYRPIEDFIVEGLGPLVANTHSESSLMGQCMTQAYQEARHIIKRHVNAGPDDVLIAAGSGMTTVINKLQRMLGLRIIDRFHNGQAVAEEDKPLVVITHMEHHSNQTTWQECAVSLEIIQAGADGLPDLAHLEEILQAYASRSLKIGSFTACSNVTGVFTPYQAMAEVMHRYGGWCLVDFAASAPYVDIDMNPNNPLHKLDGIFISPHKFLGGPGSPGVLVFDKRLYRCETPDQPGGGTVTWTNPWGGHRYYADIESREDGGTPPFLQTIRAALAFELKAAMDTKKMAAREAQLTKLLLEGLAAIEGVNLLAPEQRHRLCIVSFYIVGIHYNLVVRLLSDRFGIQARGGCSCAGTYGHILLGVDKDRSASITRKIDEGDLSEKPGWIRVSLHPTSRDSDALRIVNAVAAIVDNIEVWSEDYVFDLGSGEFEPSRPHPIPVTLAQFNPLATGAPKDEDVLQVKSADR